MIIICFNRSRRETSSKIAEGMRATGVKECLDNQLHRKTGFIDNIYAKIAQIFSSKALWNFKQVKQKEQKMFTKWIEDSQNR